MKIKLSPSQVQKQVLTPYMQQSIELLLLPITDLSMAIEQELQNNPLLEMDDTTPSEPTPGETDLQQRIEDFIKNPEPAYAANYSDDETIEEKQITFTDTLEEALLRQMRVEINDPLELKIGEYIIGNINEDGYLTVSVENIAEALNSDDLARIERILGIIQQFEPLGIASRDLKECLLIQAKEKFGKDGLLASQIINNYLKELGQRKHAEIARKLGVSADDIKETAKLIASLDPKPARNYRPLQINSYIKPDIFVVEEEETGLQIHLNKESAPTLRINPTYKNLLKKNDLKPDEKEFLKERLKNAVLFMKGLEQRGQTIKEIARFIVDKQKNFFTQGHSALIPMSLKDVAQAIDRNESTISRAVNNKYISTPQGLYPIKFFFSQAMGTEENNGTRTTVSNRSIKETIKEMIKAEDKSAPLSDQDIQDYFKQKGMTIARRTISKYRQALNIMPSHLRRE